MKVLDINELNPREKYFFKDGECLGRVRFIYESDAADQVPSEYKRLNAGEHPRES